jgi:hypothetical protein
MSTRQLTLKDFAEHCLDEIKTVQEGDTILEILSSGQVVAVVSPPPLDDEKGDLSGWIGRGVGLMSYAPGYDPSAPAFEVEDWDAFQDDKG